MTNKVPLPVTRDRRPQTP